MSSKIATLAAELAADPAGIGYAGMTDAEAAAALNTPGSGAPLQHDVDVGALERLLAAEGVLLALRDYAAGGADPTAQQACREMLALFDSINVDAFNIMHPRAQAGLDALQAAGLITATQRQAAEALAVTPKTRAEELGIAPVEAYDVHRARVL